MAEYTGFRADLWRRISELISSVYLNSLDDIQGIDDEGLTLTCGHKHPWVSMGATDEEARIILRRWSAYQWVRVGDVWRDGSDERADRLVAEMEREGQPWGVDPQLEQVIAESARAADAYMSSTFTNVFTRALTADSLRDTYEAMARMPPLRAPSNTAYQARTTATDVRISLDGVPVKLTSPSGIDIKYTAAPTTGEVQGIQRPVVPASPVSPPAPPTPTAPPPSRWALLEPDEAANPETVVQAWREAQARRKAKPRVPAYHETILDLTECSLLDAVLRCADMWDELDRADRRKRMN